MRDALRRHGWMAVVAALAALRLAHVRWLWADEDYHMLAAMRMLRGDVPYRDFWYDKPPLAGAFYALIGGHPGVALRVLGAVYVAVACAVAYRLARAWWGEGEGRLAAVLLAFFLTFYLPAAVIPLAVDGVMVAPHLAAMYCARTKRAAWCGVWCAVALLSNVKAVFVVAACAVWLWPQWGAFAAGLAGPLTVAALAAVWSGAWSPYIEQVWRWGAGYARGAPVAGYAHLAAVRVGNWCGFHSAVVVGLGLAMWRDRASRWALGVWLAASAAALFLGNHFAPRYFLQVLPVCVVGAARGWTLCKRRSWILAVLLLIPMTRFAPRYFMQTAWADTAMDADAKDVAEWLDAHSDEKATVFVWGYRPDVYVWSRRLPDGRFGDSQPLDGVPADRHLVMAGGVDDAEARARRKELARTRPDFVVDGLGKLNPRLGMETFAETNTWLEGYQVVYEGKMSRVWGRKR